MCGLPKVPSGRCNTDPLNADPLDTAPETEKRTESAPAQDTSVEEDQSKKEEEENDVKEFGLFPEHLDFVKMLRSSQRMADHVKTRVPVIWRGYKSCVLPNIPNFTTEDLRERLRDALKHVTDITTKEKEV